jgi:nicotinate-nucleotide adenylyltransferase
VPKIGIMGGTFNPVHNAHIELAKKALEQFGLDKVLFITNGNPPHKKNHFILDAFIRHKMVCLAIKDYPKFETYDYEIKKETYSYTYETLKHLKTEHI